MIFLVLLLPATHPSTWTKGKKITDNAQEIHYVEDLFPLLIALRRANSCCCSALDSITELGMIYKLCAALTSGQVAKHK